MRLNKFSNIIIVTIAATAAALSGRAQNPSASPAANLAPIAFFTAHEWDASLPNTPDGKTRKIHAQFSWTQTGQAIRINNQMVTDGKPAPYIDGLYFWDPQQHAIAFCYIGAEGALTRGTVKAENGKLIHEFQQTLPDGKTSEYVARVTPNGDKSWENEIQTRGEKGLTTIVKVRYEATP